MPVTHTLNRYSLCLLSILLVYAGFLLTSNQFVAYGANSVGEHSVKTPGGYGRGNRNDSVGKPYQLYVNSCG